MFELSGLNLTSSLKLLNPHLKYIWGGVVTWGPRRPFTVSDAFGLAIDPQFFDNSNTKGSRFSSTCLSAYLYQFVSLQPSGSTRHHHALDHPLFNLFKITISLVSIWDNATALEETGDREYNRSNPIWHMSCWRLSNWLQSASLQDFKMCMQ